ncbi:tetraspanin-3-like [Convolutriloba macropyga]|uniref:tetraspanin-3-like n=1 Tax=Convolutriloba macropyga TaxID=536237 RepID=UPI003F51DD97
MGTCTSFSKFSIFLINFLFWLIAGGLLFICTWIILQYFSTSCEFANFYLLIPLAVIGIVGVLLFLNSFVGCCGAVRESKCCLSIFFVLTFTVLCLEVTAAVLAFVFQDTIVNTVTNDWKDSVNMYGPGSACSGFLDMVQSNLTCCGCNDYTDWFSEGTNWNFDHPNKLPWSCCDMSERKTDFSDNFTYCELPSPANDDPNATDPPVPEHLQGCCSKLQEVTEGNILFFGIAGVTIALLQALVILIACGLMCRRREQLYIHLDADMSQPSTPSTSNL